MRVLPQPGGDFVGTNADEVWWNGEVDLWLDVDAFVEAAKDRVRLEEAVALYRGDLLPELYDEWLYGFRDRFRNVYLTALARLVSEMRKRGDFSRAIDVARKILESDPWREDIVRRIVALRYESGDAAGAIANTGVCDSRCAKKWTSIRCPRRPRWPNASCGENVADDDDGRR